MSKKTDYKVLKGLEFPRGTVHKKGVIIQLTEKQAEGFVEGLIESTIPATGTTPGTGAGTGTTPGTGAGTGTTPGTGAGTGTTPGTGAGTTTPATKTKKTLNKVVEVDQEVLRKLVDTVETQKQDIEDLKASADLGRLSRIQQARESGKIIKTAKLSVFNNKIVVGWIKESDDVWFDEQGRLNEDQKVCLFLDNGEEEPVKTKPMSYREFSRITTKIEGEVIGESKNKEGQVFFKIQLEDGREFELPIQFIN